MFWLEFTVESAAENCVWYGVNKIIDLYYSYIVFY